jgi:aspartate/methionine/tyrosine aminotransferase
MRLRETIAALPGSRIAEISALGFGDPDVVPLWYGEGDLPTPDFIGEAASAALRRGETFYTYKAGIPELRETIAQYLTGLYRAPVGSERIAVSSSGMTALMIATQALIDPGDNLVIIAPIWPNIAAATSIMGGEPRLVSLDPLPGGGWRLDPGKIMAACDRRTRGIFVNSPSNPPDGWRRARRSPPCSTSPASAGSGSSPTKFTAASSTAIGSRPRFSPPPRPRIA